MKFYKPLFSVVLILIQLILSVVRYFGLQNWRKENPELDALISLNITYTTLFIFVLIIGIYEIMTKQSWFKTAIRIFLVCIILGTTFSNFIPIEDFYFGVYNTAWFSAVVAFILILVKFGKFVVNKWTDRKTNKTQKACR